MLKLSDLSEGVTNVRCTYRFRFKETNKHLKLVVDQQYRYEDADGILVDECRNDVLEAVIFDKDTYELSNKEVLVAIGDSTRYYWKDEERVEARERLIKLLPELDFSVESTSVEAGGEISDFMKRLVYIKHKRLYLVGKCVMESCASKLTKYVDDFDKIEKMCLTISPETVANQINNNTLQFFEGGKKLKSLIGLPVDVITAIDKYNGQCIYYFQNYVKSGIGSVDEIRKLFTWLDALSKLHRKRKLHLQIIVDATSLSYICSLMEMGCTITSIINAVSREMLMYCFDDEFNLNGRLRDMRDAMRMQREMGNTDTHFSQNTVKWHYITARNFKILKNSRQEAYALAVQGINRNARTVDGYLIKCPETEKELFDIGQRYNNCLPLYRDKIIDEHAIIYSMYKVNENGDLIDPMPPVTFEVTPGLDFIQIKTFNDADVVDAEIISVLKKWRTQIRQSRRETTDGSC